MGIYRISWKESVRKDILRFPPLIVSRIIQKVEMLSSNPMPVGIKKLKNAEHTYRVRVSDYRIIYQINTADKEIIICRIRHRKDAY